MSYYFFLTATVIVLLALCWALWKHTKSIAFPFGIGVLYFWSLHGAWAIVTDLRGGDSQKHYHYLYDKIFPIYLDEDYVWTLGLYAAFLIIVGVTALIWVRPTRSSIEKVRPVVLSHDSIIAICGLAALSSLWIIHETIDAAIQLGASGYTVTRSETHFGWFRLHQVLNRVALLPAAIGVATVLSGGRCRYLSGEIRLRHFFGYIAVLGFMFCFCVVLGNKNELALALFSATLFYLVNSTKPRTWTVSVCAVVLLACVGFIDYARGLSVVDIADNVSVNEISKSLSRLANSNEAFAAHMSLYGAMSFELPLTYGSSIYSFLMSAIPRAIWPDRPYDIYYYYANGVAATEGQGYSIHHAAGWYLNFGVAGVIAGAFLLGRVWAALYNNLVHVARRQVSGWWRMFCIIGFFTFSANLPNLVRNGPEGYKSILVDSFIIPVAILLMAQSHKYSRRAVNNVRPMIRHPQHTLAMPKTTVVRSRRSLRSQKKATSN